MEADRASASTVLLRSNAQAPLLSLPPRPTLLDLLAVSKMPAEVVTQALGALQELVQALPAGERVCTFDASADSSSHIPALVVTHLSAQLSIFSADEVTRSTIALVRADSALLRDLVLQRVLPPMIASDSEHVLPLASAAVALCSDRSDATTCDVVLQLLQVLAEEPCTIARLVGETSVTHVLERTLQLSDSDCSTRRTTTEEDTMLVTTSRRCVLFHVEVLC
jgi:hypothetical protein